MLKNLNAIKTAYTHAGVFHADDVFSAALLQIINPEISFIRTLTPPEDQDDIIIFDIGMGQYDHHQPDRATRDMADGYWIDRTNGGEVKPLPYCAFGLLWRDYGRLLCPSPKAWKKVDRDLVLPIDKADNGVFGSQLANAIGSFNPAWDATEADPDECFLQALSVAAPILGNFIARANAEAKAESIVLSSRVVEDRILVLDQYMPWQDTVIEQLPGILYVVFPSKRGGYNVQTVPSTPGSFTPRKGFPQEWLGHPDASLGMTFCHPGNFLLSAETEDQAIAISRIAVKA